MSASFGGCSGNCNIPNGDEVVTSWLLLSTFLIASMIMGYAMLAAGSVRAAHRHSMLNQYIMDSVLSCLVYTAVTHMRDMSWIIQEDGRKRYELMVMSWAFCAICVVIGPGCMAERANFLSYLGHSVLLIGLVYIPIADAVWRDSSGFFYRQMHRAFEGDYHFHDCAGSGVVHLVGGVAALAGNILIGRRILLPDVFCDSGELTGTDNPLATGDSDSEAGCRSLERAATCLPQLDYPPQMWRRRFDDAERDRHEFRTCSYLQTMGLFMLWVGWFAVTSSACLASGGNSYTAAMVVWNTAVSGSCGGLGAYCYLYCCHVYVDIGFICNGISSGLVAGAAACDVASPLASGVIGLIAGTLIYPFSSYTIRQFTLDDPVDAISIHLACSLFGVLATALCKPDCGALSAANLLSPSQASFCSESHRYGPQMLAQTWGAFVIALWSFSISFPFWLMCVVSERVRCMEAQYVGEALDLLTAFGAASSKQFASRLDHIAYLSPSTRNILKQHGWLGFDSGFAAGRPDDPMKLFQKLSRARKDILQTTLESSMTRPLAWLVNQAHKLRPVRECAFLRIRMHPICELSALGEAVQEERRVLRAVQQAAQELQDIRCLSTPLEVEIQELTRRARHQEVLLQALAERRSRKHRNTSSNSRTKQATSSHSHHLSKGTSSESQYPCASTTFSECTLSTRLSDRGDNSLALGNMALWAGSEGSSDKQSDVSSLCSDDSFTALSDEDVSIASNDSEQNFLPACLETLPGEPSVRNNSSQNHPSLLSTTAHQHVSSEGVNGLAASIRSMMELQQQLLFALLANRSSEAPLNADAGSQNHDNVANGISSLSCQAAEVISGHAPCELPVGLRAAGSSNQSLAQPYLPS